MSEVIKKAFAKNWSFWICLGVSITLGMTGFFMPPQGEAILARLSGFRFLGDKLYVYNIIAC